MENKAYKLIQERDEFLDVTQKLKTNEILGVDLEGEWNLHRYGLHLCLIQVNDGKETWLIDPLKVGDLAPFLEIIEDESIRIISHGPQSDIILLDYLYGCRPRNIFDTEKAAKLLNYPSTSLSGLLEEHIGISKNTKIRASDWNIRPISEKMLDYAALDVIHLIQIYDELVAKLKEKGRYSWQEEENKMLEEIRHKPKENPEYEIDGANKLTRRQRNILTELYNLRESIAKSNDRPAYHIIQNQRLIQLAKESPKTPAEWADLKGVNPKVRNFASEFHEATQTGKEIPIELDPDRYRNRKFNGLSKEEYYRQAELKKNLLEKLRLQLIEEYGDISQLILSGRIIKKLAYGESGLSDLRIWQREILEKAARQHDLQLEVLQETGFVEEGL